MSILDQLESLDQQLFHSINSLSGTAAIDVVVVAISSHWIWLPVVFLTYFMVKGHPRAALVMLMAGILVGISDLLGYQVLKPFFERLRPCHSLEGVQIVKGCGGKFGFPSNHAMNSASFAYFLLFVTRKAVLSFLLLFAGFVALSRVYLGVHYPFDILFGHSLGLVLATLSAYLCKKLWKL